MRYSMVMVAPAPSSSSTSTLAATLAMNATEAVMGSSSSGASSSGSSSSSPTTAAAKFNPSMAIIIVVLLGTFFFMGFLSVYVKKCVTTEGEYMDHQYWAAAAAAAAAESSSAAGGWVVQNLGAPSQGLDKSLIHALPIVGFSKARECCVCLGDFQDTDCLRLLPRCGHTFHVECIDTWLVSHTTCPLCRFHLTAETVLVPVAEPAQEQEQGPGLGRPMHQGADGEISATGVDGGDAAQPDLTVEDPPQPECSEDDRSRLHGVLRKVWELLLARIGSTGLGRVVRRA